MREESLALVRQRFDAELENQGQLSQAQSELAQARGDLIEADGRIERVRHALAALLGKGPDRGLDIALPGAVHVASLGVPANLGAELIGRRPDLVAARERAEAAARRIDVARADFYPNINLTALVGLQSIGLDMLRQRRLAVWSNRPGNHLADLFGRPHRRRISRRTRGI